MITFSRIAHRNLEICSPVPWQMYQELLSLIKLPKDPLILDIGCGKCGLLAKATEFTNGTGLGIDLPESLASDPVLLALELKKSSRLDLHFGPAEEFLKKNTKVIGKYTHIRV